VTTEDDFQRQLDAHPDDAQTRLVFADWLEEHGDERAEGYRALGALRRNPQSYPLSTRRVWAYQWNHDEVWWAYMMGRRKRRTQGVFVLPESWIRLAHTPPTAGGCDILCDSRREAEDAAALAFAKLPASRRAELLSPAGVPA
jgi:uncharacterized protein (TIGR02996 family)